MNLAAAQNNVRCGIEDEAEKKGFLKIKGNIWKQETVVQKQLRAEHEKYVAGLREEQERALAELRSQSELALAKEKAKHATALATVNRQLDFYQDAQVKLLAEINGRGALMNNLSNALAEENPDNPLVSPVLREKITSDARKETLIKMGADPNMSFN